jgi:hypothetical protein
VDTHADVHVAAALDPIGGRLGVQEFPVTPADYARLLEWLGGFGTVCLVGIEGTGSYGAGLARHLTAAGVRVVEVDHCDRQDRRPAPVISLILPASSVVGGVAPSIPGKPSAGLLPLYLLHPLKRGCPSSKRRGKTAAADRTNRADGFTRRHP